jgi:8-oxo-dGTP pyrophosphatase MutT (NUDIX family)
MLLQERLTPAADNFFYISRWITPPLFHIRYDTRFFAAVMPENQETSHDGNELIDFEWINPGEALQRYREGRIKLVMPTIKTLELLSRFNKAEDVIEYLKYKS